MVMLVKSQQALMIMMIRELNKMENFINLFLLITEVLAGIKRCYIKWKYQGPPKIKTCCLF